MDQESIPELQIFMESIFSLKNNTGEASSNDHGESYLRSHKGFISAYISFALYWCGRMSGGYEIQG